jgi:hypothetical protein
MEIRSTSRTREWDFRDWSWMRLRSVRPICRISFWVTSVEILIPRDGTWNVWDDTKIRNF